LDYFFTEVTLDPVCLVLLFTVACSLMIVEDHQVWEEEVAQVALIPLACDFYFVRRIGVLVEFAYAEIKQCLIFYCQIVVVHLLIIKVLSIAFYQHRDLGKKIVLPHSAYAFNA